MNTERTLYNNQFNNPFHSTTPTPPLRNPALENDSITVDFAHPALELLPQPPQSQPIPHHNRRFRGPFFPNPNRNLHYPPQPITNPAQPNSSYNPNPNPLQQHNQSSYNPYPTRNIHSYNRHSNEFSPYYRRRQHHHTETHAPITIQINCTNCSHTNHLVITRPQVLTMSMSRSSLSSLTSSSTNWTSKSKSQLNAKYLQSLINETTPPLKLPRKTKLPVNLNKRKIRKDIIFSTAQYYETSPRKKKK